MEAPVRNALRLPGLLAGSSLLLASFLLGACGEDGDETVTVTTTSTAATLSMTTTATVTGATTEVATATQATPGVIEVTGTDYAFEGVPDTVAPGTEFMFTNGSDAEVHELLLFQIPEGEQRSLDELLALPDAEAEAIVGEPLGVAVAMPGEDGTVVEGALVVEQPGRYVMLCFIPVGADPEVFRAAMEDPSAQPPEVEGGPPHVAQGMSAEFTVE